MAYISTFDRPITSIDLCVGFFDKNYPDLIVVGIREGDFNTSIIMGDNWNVIIDDDFGPHPIDIEPDRVHTVLVCPLNVEESLDKAGSLCQGAEAAKEVAISQNSLMNIAGVDIFE